MILQKILTTNKYRWCLIAAVEFWIVLFVMQQEINPELMQFWQLHFVAANLSKQWLARQVNNQLIINSQNKNYQLSAAKIFPELFKLLQQPGLETVSLAISSPITQHGMQIMLIKIVMNGSYVEFVNFLGKLLGQPLAMFVSQFSVKMLPQGGLQAAAQLEIWPKIILAKNKQLISLTQINPFCNGNHFYTSALTATAQSDISSSLFSIKEMKQVGFLHFGKRDAALMMTPNNQVLLVEPGELLGREQAKIVRIEQNKLVMQP